MKYFIEIELEKSAFDEFTGGELARIVRAAADRVELFSFRHTESRYPLKDINGNTVGFHGYSHKTVEVTP